VAFDIALDESGLIAMAAQVPDEDPEAVEIVGMIAAPNGGPEPVMLDLIAIAHLSERKIRGDAMAFGVLRHIVGNRHIEPPRDHPSALALSVAHQAPIVGGQGAFGLRLGLGFIGSYRLRDFGRRPG